MVWWILLFLVIGILIVLLFIPISLRVDSTTNSIKIKLFLIAEGGIILQESYPWLEVKVFGIRWKWDLIKMISKAGKKKDKAEKDSKRKSFPLQNAQIKNLIKSFEIKEWVFKLDTNDPWLNSMLFPLFYWLEQLTGKTIRINFTHDNQLTLEIENQGYKILWAIINKM